MRRGDEHERPSQFELAIAKGAAGEERLGRELTAFAQEMELAVLHDLTLPGSNANIDHLAIGPAGVTVIDAKAWDGRVWIGEKTMRQGRQSRYPHLVAVTEQQARVRDALASAGIGDVPVDGVLCLVNGNQGVPVNGLTRSAGIGIGSIPGVLQHIARRGTVDLDSIWRVNDALQERFRVHGGTYVPGRSVAPPHQDVTYDQLLQKFNAENAEEQRRRHRARDRRNFLLAGAAAFGLLCAFIGTRLETENPRLSSTTMTTAGLRHIRPQLREIAIKRAGGSVHGPSVTSSAEQFTLRYRRGERCRVTLTINRVDSSRTVQSANCRR